MMQWDVGQRHGQRDRRHQQQTASSCIAEFRNSASAEHAVLTFSVQTWKLWVSFDVMLVNAQDPTI